jgi:para-aminobenzoate synthetase component I
MRSLIIEVPFPRSPEAVVEQLQGQPGIILLRSGWFLQPTARYSFVTARPFLTLRGWGSRCEIRSAQERREQYGNPWRLLESLLSGFELLDQADWPFPVGGCFGYWGYDLKNFVEPKLPRRASNDLGLPDCHLGFYHSLIAFDHQLGKSWIVATGLDAEGLRTERRATAQIDWWQSVLLRGIEDSGQVQGGVPPLAEPQLISSITRAEFLEKVARAKRYIRAGDIYQVNLSHRLALDTCLTGRQVFERLASASPAPFSAFVDCGDFQLASSSPELFLRMTGQEVQTRPIKGTRPRSPDTAEDARLAYALRTSNKELAELVMITDLLRNDLGKICEFGSVRVRDLARLEAYPQVQHLVSSVTGRLRSGLNHLQALEACFPGGSITGAPKFRAMEIIDELEPVARGPYTGALGYLGFNQESQLSIIIRCAVCIGQTVYFHTGAGIVADSSAEAEYAETLHKAAGIHAALNRPKCEVVRSS